MENQMNMTKLVKKASAGIVKRLDKMIVIEALTALTSKQDILRYALTDELPAKVTAMKIVNKLYAGFSIDRTQDNVVVSSVKFPEMAEAIEELSLQVPEDEFVVPTFGGNAGNSKKLYEDMVREMLDSGVAIEIILSMPNVVGALGKDGIEAVAAANVSEEEATDTTNSAPWDK